MLSPELYPYQRDGEQFLVDNAIAFLLMEMGLGKTAVALSAAARVDPASVLVLCPPSLAHHWRDECMTWAPQLAARLEVFPFSLCSRRKSGPAREKQELVIVDECQSLKAPASQRTKHVYGPGGVGDNAKRVWLLSGTPTPNGPHELYPHLRALLPSLIARRDGKPMTYDQFLHWTSRLLMTMHGPKVLRVRKDTVTALRTRMAPFVFARRKQDVNRDLPSLTINHVRLHLNKAMNNGSADLRERMRAALDDDAVVSAAEQMHLSTLRAEHGVAKAPAVARMLLDEFESGELTKVVVFCQHRKTMNNIARDLQGDAEHDIVGQIHGDVSLDDRAALVRRFRTDDKLKTLVCQIDAAGVGLNMEVADQVVMAEASWSPGANAQAIARCHRITSKRPVTARFVGIANSIDDAVMRALARKTKHIASTWGDATTAA